MSDEEIAEQLSIELAERDPGTFYAGSSLDRLRDVPVDGSIDIIEIVKRIRELLKATPS